MSVEQTVGGRVMPRLPVWAVKTYSVLSPLRTHFRPATCEEIDCPHYLKGWRSAYDARDQTSRGGAFRIWYVREQSGRRFVELGSGRWEIQTTVDGAQIRKLILGDGPLTVFEFAPGQMCFEAATHRITLERDPIFVVQPGDWRGHDGPPVQMNNADWADSHQTIWAKVAETRAQG